ncbi:MAG TPA: hypothetical protein VLE93_01490 [Candidatus Saccharimonadales bacterium]|nr:hypothetical protein [Candidatus Saccharimonadales bacterium]
MPLRRNNQYNRRAYKTGSRFSVGPTTARYLILILLAIFSLLYLIQAAQGSSNTIELQNLQKQKTGLDQQLTTLQVNASRLQSVQNLNQSAATQGLVPVESNPTTITVPAGH